MGAFCDKVFCQQLLPVVIVFDWRTEMHLSFGNYRSLPKYRSPFVDITKNQAYI
jgi:hypothetical protein